LDLKSIQRKYFVVILHIGEGKNADSIDIIARQVTLLPQIALLEVKPHLDRDCTQLTVAVQLEQLPELVLAVANAVQDNISLEDKDENYPWVGTLDNVIVTPLLLRNLPLATSAARDMASLLAERFHTPVFLCGKAATIPEQTPVRFFRHYKFHQIVNAIREGHLKPDYGENQWNHRMGAILLGARLNYISFALYLDTEDVEIVEAFAKSFTRYLGIGTSESEGRPLEKRVKMRRLDILREVHTIVDLESEHRLVKLMCKIVDYQRTPLHEVYTVLDRAFDYMGIKIVGSQIFGFVPFEVFQLTGRYFFKGKSLRHMDDLHFFTLALNRLRVDAIEPFYRDLQILEYRIRKILEMHQQSH